MKKTKLIALITSGIVATVVFIIVATSSISPKSIEMTVIESNRGSVKFISKILTIDENGIKKEENFQPEYNDDGENHGYLESNYYVLNRKTSNFFKDGWKIKSAISENYGHIKSKSFTVTKYKLVKR